MESWSCLRIRIGGRESLCCLLRAPVWSLYRERQQPLLLKLQSDGSYAEKLICRLKKKDFRYDPYMRRELLYIALAQGYRLFWVCQSRLPLLNSCPFRNNVTYIRMSRAVISRRKKKTKSRRERKRFDAPMGMVRRGGCDESVLTSAALQESYPEASWSEFSLDYSTGGLYIIISVFLLVKTNH